MRSTSSIHEYSTGDTDEWRGTSSIQVQKYLNLHITQMKFTYQPSCLDHRGRQLHHVVHEG